MTKIDEKQSEQMISSHDADPDAYFTKHAIGEYLPPLAPSIMRRLRNRDGSSAELAYYRKSKAYFRAIKPLTDALDAAAAFEESLEGQAIRREIERELSSNSANSGNEKVDDPQLF